MNIVDKSLLNNIKNLLESSRQQLQQTVNTTMVQTYWHISRLIVEEEQNGNTRAEYGKQQLLILSEELTKDFGKGFDVTNLRKMRQFYITFPEQDTVSLKLSWSHTLTPIVIPAKVGIFIVCIKI